MKMASKPPVLKDELVVLRMNRWQRWRWRRKLYKLGRLKSPEEYQREREEWDRETAEAIATMAAGAAAPHGRRQAQ